MAYKRMFNKEITNSDVFLDMPLSSQALYFHLGLNADDDGFVSPRSIIRLVGAKDDDLKVLIMKGFLIQFSDGVIVITHWKRNNNIRADRYTPTVYKEHMKILNSHNNIYSLVSSEQECVPLVGQVGYPDIDIDTDIGIDTEGDFQKFWDLYNKKVGDKQKIQKKWNNLKEIDRQKIMETLPIFLRGIRDKQFQPFPETYLNNKRRLDEQIQNNQDGWTMQDWITELNKMTPQTFQDKYGKEKRIEVMDAKALIF